MAKEKDNNTSSDEVADNSPSMEDILKSIRGVISGDENPDEDQDVLELTDMIEEGNPIEQQTTVTSEGKSVLDQIDEVLKDDSEFATIEKVEEEKAEEQIPVFDIAKEQVTAEPLVEETVAQEEQVFEPVEEKNNEEDLRGAFSNNFDSENGRLLREKVADESTKTLKKLVDNLPKSQIVSPYTTGGVTLEQLTIEAMKPFLAEWLNNNLPTIVKQIVTKEIRKLIPDEEK